MEFSERILPTAINPQFGDGPHADINLHCLVNLDIINLAQMLLFGFSGLRSTLISSAPFFTLISVTSMISCKASTTTSCLLVCFGITV